MSKRIATIYDYMRFKKAVCGRGGSCCSCPFGYGKNGEKVICNTLLTDYTDKANEIILKWCDEHPAKTYKDDFLEKFPNAQTHKGFPNVCRDTVYGTNNHKCKTNVKCEDCWNEVMPE